MTNQQIPPDYKLIAFKSRKLDPNNNQFCEYCYFTKDKLARAIDIDHIDWRWWSHNIDNRMYDPYNLILLCRDCHSNKTNKSKIASRKIVKYIIDTDFYNKLNTFQAINKKDYLKY